MFTQYKILELKLYSITDKSALLPNIHVITLHSLPILAYEYTICPHLFAVHFEQSPSLWLLRARLYGCTLSSLKYDFIVTQ